MTQYIDKSVLVAEIKRLENDEFLCDSYDMATGFQSALRMVQEFINTLEVKEFQEKNLYVVTRCEEHSDYVEKAFFSKKKAEKYCKQFEGDEDAYGRDITEIKVDCPPFEMKETNLEKEAENFVQTKEFVKSKESPVLLIAKHFYELGLKSKIKQ